MGTQTVVRFNAGGQGVAISPTNAGITSTTLNGGTAVFDAAAAGEGAFGVTVTSVAGLQALFDTPMQVGAKIQATEQTIRTPVAYPNVDSRLIEWRSLANGLVCSLYFSTAGRLYLQGRGGSASVTILASAPLNTQYDFGMLFNVGVATVAPYDGTFSATLYLHSDHSVVAGPITNNAYNLGVDTVDYWRAGVITALTAATAHKYDTFRSEDGRTTYLGVYTPPANNPPTIAPITDVTVAVTGTTTVTAVASDTDGTVSTSSGHSWVVKSYPGPTPPNLTNSSTQTVTVGPCNYAGTVVLGDTVTDNGGAQSAERTMNVFVTAAAGSTVNVSTVVANPGGYSPGGTATDVLDGTSDAGEYVLSPAGPNMAELDLGFVPLPGNDVTVDLYADLVKSDGTTLADVGQTGTVTAQLFAGAVAISNLVNVAISRTETHVQIVLTAGQNTAFTAAGRSNPVLVLKSTAS